MSSKPKPLDSFETFGWTPNDSLSDDENFMDLILLITRSSILKQGSMACILARSATLDAQQDESLLDRIVSVTTNRAFYTTKDSDIHAEMVAIAEAAQHGQKIDQTTAYITMPPCKRCFPALVTAGISRIVSRKTFSPGIVAGAAKRNVELVTLDANAIMGRVNEIVTKHKEKAQESSGCKRKAEGDPASSEA